MCVVHDIGVCNGSVLSLRRPVGDVMAGRAACARSHRPVHCFRLVLATGPSP